MKNLKHIVPFSLFEGIEDKGRLSDKITGILNKQIKNELLSSQIYRGMSCWLDDKGWIDASKYFFKSAQEELVHMEKVYQYLFDRNVLAKVPTVEGVKETFKDIRDVLEESLKHEMEVSVQWNDIAKEAKAENDNTTYEFSQWFIKEQVEEEEKFRNFIFKMNLDMPDYEIDDMFKL